MVVGSGIDVIEIARIERALERSGDRFARRVFAPAEIESCRARARPGPHFALRFAVKEAVMKALGTGWAEGVRWTDIETVAPEPGRGEGKAQRWTFALRGRAAECAARLGGERRHLAVSRTRRHVVAVVLLESSDP